MTQDYVKRLEEENESLRTLVNNYKTLVLSHHNKEIEYKSFMDSILLQTYENISKTIR